MQQTISFPPKLVDLQNYYFFENGFSDDELEKIYTNVANLSFTKGTTGADNNEDNPIRSSQIKWIPTNDEWSWLYTKLINMIIEANNAIWNFNLHGGLDLIQYTEYHATDKGHYGWHQDIGSGPMSTRKISVTVQISDSSEYEGGDLEYFSGGDPEKAVKVPRKKGLVFIFPSFMMHRVTPVTKGTRKSFVLWVGGESYK